MSVKTKKIPIPTGQNTHDFVKTKFFMLAAKLKKEVTSDCSNGYPDGIGQEVYKIYLTNNRVIQLTSASVTVANGDVCESVWSKISIQLYSSKDRDVCDIKTAQCGYLFYRLRCLEPGNTTNVVMDRNYEKINNDFREIEEWAKSRDRIVATKKSVKKPNKKK